jgi:hypothetical protein
VQVKDHVLLPQASQLDAADEAFKSILSPELVKQIVALVPDEWLIEESSSESASEKREVYSEFLNTRIANSKIFVNEAKHARESLI